MNVAPGVAKRARSRERERRRVEPLVRRLIRYLRMPNDVWTIVGAEAENRTTRAAVIDVRQQSNRKRTSRLNRDDTVSFPTTRNSRQPTIIRQILPDRK